MCGDLNDIPQAATTQLLPGRPGSHLGTGVNQPDRMVRRGSRLAFGYALGRSWAMISTHRSTHSLQM